MRSLHRFFVRRSIEMNKDREKDNDIIDVGCMSAVEQKSRMYCNLLVALAMYGNRPVTYEEADDMMDSIYGSYTGAKTTCVYWRRTLMKENVATTCNDPDCEQKQPHRICSRKFYRKTRVIWLQRTLAKSVFKHIAQEQSCLH